MRKALVCSIVVLLAGASRAIAAGPELESDEQKTLYALGLAISHNLSSFALSEADLELVKAGLSDGIQHKEPKVDIQTYGPKIAELQQARTTAAAAVEKKAAQGFLVELLPGLPRVAVDPVDGDLGGVLRPGQALVPGRRRGGRRGRCAGQRAGRPAGPHRLVDVRAGGLQDLV